MKINYFDFGLYNGEEIRYMLDIFEQLDITDFSIYGFEANIDMYKTVQNRYANKNYINLYNVALANRHNEVVKLYQSQNVEGSSIIQTKNNVNINRFKEVNGIIFSKWLEENIPNFKECFNIIKANIEGAERYLINDIKDSGLINDFKLYIGKWDDINKCSELKEHIEEYENIFKDNNITIHRFSYYNKKENADVKTLIKDLLVK